MTLDNINVMYVSLSRAILENHVICQEKNIDAEKTSGTLLRSYFSTSSTKSKTFCVSFKDKLFVGSSNTINSALL